MTPDPTANCYASFINVQSEINNMTSQWSTYGSNYALMGKEAMAVGIQAYNMYYFCQATQYMIKLGKLLNSFSGLADGLVNSMYRIF